MARLFLVTASVSAFFAVAFGAFAAHVLKEKLSPDLFNVFEVAVRYHMYHALGLFMVALAMAQFPNLDVSLTGWLFVAGTIVFSGSLYALSLTGARWLGALTPAGGVCFLAGWAWFGWRVW